MSPLTKILTTTITAGLTSSIVAAVSAFIILTIFSNHFGIVFGGSSNYRPSEKIISIVCLVCLVLSLVVCPFLAYYLRESVFELTPLPTLRILLFLLIGSAQFSFLVVESFTVFPYAVKTYRKVTAPPSTEEVRRIRTDKVSKQLKEVNIEVSVTRAKIIYDDGTNVIAELTLQIQNVPLIVDDYSLEFRDFKQGENFVVGTRNFSNRRVKFGTIQAVNEGGNWAFYGQPGRELVSNNSNQVTLQIGFFKTMPNNPTLPQTVKPLLRTILRDGTGAYAQFEIFNRPVPVSFESP